MVGFCKVDITPSESMPMAGLGNSSQRKSKAVLEHIFATCIALTDVKENTALFFSLDIQNAYRPVAGFREAVSKAVGLPEERVMMSFTHNHSSVDIDNRAEASVAVYNEWLCTLLINAAEAALAERKAAQMHMASVETAGLNFVRRYIMNDGSLCGDNFGSMETGIRQHETEADRVLQMIRFAREGGKDVLLTNFQTHSNYTISSGMLSSDVAGAFRDALEAVSGCHVIHFNGASGNINPKSRVPEENIASDHRDWGKRLANYAIKAEFSPVPARELRTQRFTFQAKANHSQDHLLPVAHRIRDTFYATNDRAKCKEMGLPHGITSAYHAIAIIGNSGLPEKLPVHMFVFSLGDVALAFAPIEMFDTNGMYIKQNSPFAKVICRLNLPAKTAATKCLPVYLHPETQSHWLISMWSFFRNCMNRRMHCEQSEIWLGHARIFYRVAGDDSRTELYPGFGRYS